MNEASFNIASIAVFCPGQDAKTISELRPNNENVAYSLHYKEATKLLARKGLRYKDEATVLALVTAKQVLDKANANALTEEQKIRTSIIVSSNLSNIDTVVENAKIIADKHVNATSAMALPNASSNAVSASIAIFNELKGPNLMLCNGKDSGIDALKLAQDLMLADRADRVLVVGVEVDNDCVKKIFSSEKVRFHGAAGYLLEIDKESSNSGLPVIARLHSDTFCEFPMTDREVFEYCGDASGATGVLQVVLATEYALRGIPRQLIKNSNSWQVEMI